LSADLRVDLGNLEIPVRLCRNPRARRLILRLDPDGDGVVVTLPPGAPEHAGLELARKQADWIRRRLGERTPRIAFEPGAAVPIAGRPRIISWTGQLRGGVTLSEDAVQVSGRREHLARRLTDWLRAEARRRILPLVADKAARIERKPGRVSIRDTRSRWGSCAAGGNLSFCWRLVMAPPEVLDYVVAHEVAHLAHHDHSARFWRQVEVITEHSGTAKDWLRRHGPGLHRYG